MTRNRWGAAKDAPVTGPSALSIRHSNKSGYFLEYHVPAIETDAANRVLLR
jgi:hypothetical protein